MAMPSFPTSKTSSRWLKRFTIAPSSRSAAMFGVPKGRVESGPFLFRSHLLRRLIAGREHIRIRGVDDKRCPSLQQSVSDGNWRGLAFCHRDFDQRPFAVDEELLRAGGGRDREALCHNHRRTPEIVTISRCE